MSARWACAWGWAWSQSVTITITIRVCIQQLERLRSYLLECGVPVENVGALAMEMRWKLVPGHRKGDGSIDYVALTDDAIRSFSPRPTGRG